MDYFDDIYEINEVDDVSDKSDKGDRRKRYETQKRIEDLKETRRMNKEVNYYDEW
jgi:hypothetical protein